MEFRYGKKVSSFISVGSCDENIKTILLQIKKQGNLIKRYRHCQTVETDNNQNGILICKHFRSENT